jgi:hypothetical protein
VKHLLFALSLTVVACGTEKDEDKGSATTTTPDRSGVYSLTASEELGACSKDNAGVPVKHPKSAFNVKVTLAGNEMKVEGGPQKLGTFAPETDVKDLVVSGYQGLLDTSSGRYTLTQTGTATDTHDGGKITMTHQIEGELFDNGRWYGLVRTKTVFEKTSIVCESILSFTGAKQP